MNAQLSTPNVDVPELGAPRTSLARGLVATARPRQWAKNILVFAAPLAAEVLRERTVIARLAVAFVALCIAASGTYFVNDVTDRKADRGHPIKRQRPVATGALSVSVALAVGLALLLIAFGVAATLGPAFLAVIAAYVVLTLLYSVWLKLIPVVDIAAVATGFLLRAIAGAVAVPVPISTSFLLVASFGALFVVVGKRHGDRLAVDVDAAPHRPTLAAYTPEFTAQLVSASLTATLVCYATWAFALDVGEGGIPWVAWSVLPFTVGMLRATQLVVRGEGIDPERMAEDPGLLLAGVTVVLLLVAGLYVW
jgi:decaprenyl-phosphate phosphoribosyltransferase